MKWIREKYEWLFYLLYVKFKAIYPKGAYPENYAFWILNLPLWVFMALLMRELFPHLTRNQIAIIGVILSIPLVNYFNDERIEEIEKRYEDKE